LCKPPLWPLKISGAGADPVVHRTPGISPRVNSRSRTPSSRRCSEVNRMVVPFGSALQRRSRATYRPTVTPEGSTHVETFTGTTSSFSGTASGKLAVVAVVRQQVFAEAPGPAAKAVTLSQKIQRIHSHSLDKCRERLLMPVVHFTAAGASPRNYRRGGGDGREAPSALPRDIAAFTGQRAELAELMGTLATAAAGPGQVITPWTTANSWSLSLWPDRPETPTATSAL